jgi:hypothetical protein
VALGLAFLVAFAYEGLGGAFEDARHLWVLFGLFLAAKRLEQDSHTTSHRPLLVEAQPGDSRLRDMASANA